MYWHSDQSDPNGWRHYSVSGRGFTPEEAAQDFLYSLFQTGAFQGEAFEIFNRVSPSFSTQKVYYGSSSPEQHYYRWRFSLREKKPSGGSV